MGGEMREGEYTAFLARRGMLAAAFAAALVPVPVMAQGSEDEAVEEIVVTGSRIARRDSTAPSPITTVDRSTIENTGQPTLEETLNQMPQVIPDFGRTSNNPGNGTSRINLRGLGSQRTLVLLNGRRLAPSGISSSVDLNNLPQALFDTGPAFMADQGNQNNTDGGMYDLFGRSYQLSFSLRY
jgi:outer membrane cobalamin receptor